MAMIRPRIVVVGSSNTDFIIRLERIPKPGETLLGGEFLNAAGGKGANQAVAAARAGGAVSFVARVGKDSLGDQAVANFVDDGIDVSCVVRDPRAASGAALIFVARNGENSIAVASGANNNLTPADVRKARPLIARAKVVLMQLETPLVTVQAAARLGAAAGALVILNPAPARKLPGSLLELVSILTPNETEAELLTGIEIKNVASAARAAEKLRRRGVGTVVLTLGAAGALVADDQGTDLVAGFKVKAVDTTAAGDTFNGALAVALAEGQSLRQAVQLANAAAAISVTRVGAQPSAPDRKSIQRLLERGRVPTG
jgi:ribokinase